MKKLIGIKKTKTAVFISGKGSNLENLIKSIYMNIGLKNKEEFINYINSFHFDFFDYR